MSNLETLFVAQKEKCDEARAIREMSQREKAQNEERNVNFVVNKLGFVTKYGGSLLRFGVGFNRCWIYVKSPRYGNIGGVLVTGETIMDDNSVARTNFSKESKNMTWEEVVTEIGKRF